MENDNRATQMVAFARECLGTPFHHQGRMKSVGMDCIGLIVYVLNRIGIAVKDRTDYGVRPDGKRLEEALLAHGFFKVDTIQAGDVLLFRYDGQPQHVGLASDENHMTHSFAPSRCVIETSLGDYWKRRLLGIYRLSDV